MIEIPQLLFLLSALLGLKEDMYAERMYLNADLLKNQATLLLKKPKVLKKYPLTAEDTVKLYAIFEEGTYMHEATQIALRDLAMHPEDSSLQLTFQTPSTASMIALLGCRKMSQEDILELPESLKEGYFEAGDLVLPLFKHFFVGEIISNGKVIHHSDGFSFVVWKSHITRINLGIITPFEKNQEYFRLSPK